MALDKNRAFELLQEMGFERQAGTPEELKAAEMLKKEVEITTNLKAEIVPFEITEGRVFNAELEILEPYQKSYKVTGYKCCMDTPEEGITADFMYVSNVTDADLIDAKGKIVLFNGYLRIPAFRALLKAGVAGIISFSGSMLNEREDNDLFTRKLRDTLLHFGNLPALHIDVNDAFELVRDGASKARMKVSGETIKINSHNVEVTIEGSEFPEQIVSFGAHYDSTEFSTGVYDNGAGSVINMEIMKHYAENQPKRTLKFLWYGSEEIGLCGSTAYVKSLSDEEFAKHIFMINVDVGGSVLGANYCDVTASNEMLTFLNMYMKANGYAFSSKQSVYSSDSVPFVDRGVPAINFYRAGAEGSSFIHTRHDIMRFLSADGLGELITPVFEFCDLLINSAVFPEPREIPANMREDVEKYLYKKELAE